MTHDDSEPNDCCSKPSTIDQKDEPASDNLNTDIVNTTTQSQSSIVQQEESDIVRDRNNQAFCYNPHLDDEIRTRLDKLNALSDLINSLERQFDDANQLFSDTLKQSTERLSSLTKILGKKSIKYGRIYHATRLSLEKSQNECQKACIEFEQAVKDHLSAKEAIQQAEIKLKDISINVEQGSSQDKHHNDIDRLDEIFKQASICPQECDKEDDSKDDCSPNAHQESIVKSPLDATNNELDQTYSNQSVIQDAAKLNEELDRAITRLSLAERKRSESRKHHLDKANKLMLDQNTLLNLERDHPISIRRSQLYFDESKRFNCELNNVKSEIARISSDILITKQAYARTLGELETFSEELHHSSHLRNNNDNI